jgi:hypothetical protein
LLDHSSVRPLHGDGRATRNYRIAIPELSRRLGVWPAEQLLDPRPPLRVVMRHLALRAMHKAYRLAVRPLGMTK